jgi:hypothetical protein
MENERSVHVRDNLSQARKDRTSSQADTNDTEPVPTKSLLPSFLLRDLPADTETTEQQTIHCGKI